MIQKANYSKIKSVLPYLISIGVVMLPAVALADAAEPWEGAYTAPEFAGGAIRNLYCDLVNEVEGSFGALQFIVAGIAGLGYAAFGDAKKSYGIILSGVAAATIGTGISLYFGDLCATTNTARVKFEDSSIVAEDRAAKEFSYGDEEANQEEVF